MRRSHPRQEPQRERVKSKKRGDIHRADPEARARIWSSRSDSAKDDNDSRDDMMKKEDYFKLFANNDTSLGYNNTIVHGEHLLVDFTLSVTLLLRNIAYHRRLASYS